MMGIRNVKKKVEKKKAAEEKKAEEKKKEIQEKKPEPEPAPQPAEDAGRVATPIEKDEPRDTSVAVRDTVPEEERPTISAPEPTEEITQDTVVSSTLKTPGEVKKLEEAAVEAKRYDQVQKLIAKKKLDEALKLAKQIQNPEKMNEAIENIADTYAVNTFDSGKGDYSKALKVAKNIKDDLFYSRVLKEIVEDWQIEDKNPDNVLDAEKTLKLAEKAAERAEPTKKEAKEEKEKLLGEIYDLKLKLDKKIKNSRKLSELKKSRTVKFAAKIAGEVIAGIIATALIASYGFAKSCANGENKPEKEPAVLEGGEVIETATKEEFDALKEEYDLEEANRFPELKNGEVEVAALKGQRKMEDIEADIDDVEGMLETYEDESKKKLNKNEQELAVSLTKKYIEGKLQDPELDEVDKDGYQLALEDEELMKGFEKEALQAMLAELQLERTEAEKLKTYLESEEVMEQMKADLCPVSPIDPSREGNGVCDRNPVKKFVGKDGEVMYVSVPYDEKDLCPSEPCTKKGKPGQKRESKGW